MRLLLDTHVFIWLQSQPERLGARLALLEDLDNDLLVSAVVPWEIAIKHAAGRLTLPRPPGLYVAERMRDIRGTSLAIEQRHALAVASLPPLHRDPFDRMLVAQAQVLDVPIMTADPKITVYEVETLIV